MTGPENLTDEEIYLLENPTYQAEPDPGTDQGATEGDATDVVEGGIDDVSGHLDDVDAIVALVDQREGALA